MLTAMSGWDEVTTYEQLQAMTPQERSEHFDASIVVDPDSLPALERQHIHGLSARLNERSRAREERLRGQAS